MNFTSNCSVIVNENKIIQFAANLLRDRYESLQRRGALAAAVVMMKKKKNLKSYFKPGHKVTKQEIDRCLANIRDGVKKLSSE